MRLSASPYPNNPIEEYKVAQIKDYCNVIGLGEVFEHHQIINLLHSRYVSGDVANALELITFLRDADEGLVRDIDVRIPLKGAENDRGVTCYSDALLFAMFARLRSFEGLLYIPHSDLQTRKLQSALRLWVNVLRSGKLITTDLVVSFRVHLAEAGWQAAASSHQQDTAELFIELTSRLNLPTLTLQVDLVHGALVNQKDDSKIMTERMLSLPIPEATTPYPILLQDCLKAYFFDNQVEVRRTLLGTKDSSDASGTREAMVQAFQVFQLLPFISALPNQSASDASLATFASQNIVLPISLKRYGVDMKGNAYRISKPVTCEEHIRLPALIAEGAADDPCGCGEQRRYQLELRSVVCHHGQTVNSGHYVAYVRDAEAWLKFDDLALPRVTRLTTLSELSNLYADEIAKNAYVLFYELVETHANPQQAVQERDWEIATALQASELARASGSSGHSADKSCTLM